MTVYVDSLRPSLRSPRWPFAASCHLFADSVEELHGFADRIGLRRSWFQPGRGLPHYDLTGGKRAMAIRDGAVEASDRMLADWMHARGG